MIKIKHPAVPLFALLCMLLAACGQRGPLYLPTPGDSSPPPAASPVPPAESEDETGG